MKSVLWRPLGQDVRFQEVDFSRGSVVVERRGTITSPISVTIRPLTVAQYQTLGVTGCLITPGEDPAEGEHF